MDHELSPLGIGLNVQPECKLHCEVRLFLSVGKKSGLMNVRVFIVAIAVILLFKNAETPGAFLRHQVAGWEVVSLDIVSKFEPTILCDIRSWTTYVPGALRHGLGQPRLHGIQPRADDAPATAPGGS